ncbi:hypothetical protein [Plasmodium yoelii yoelii]|uniref:Uncharacterized protein n=1 Tax=Plasmodium yoelii yoelii TaxID=73239 RepID=Q7RH66_PLAYO|nr:hypothetical protein [Plasmodium yoelii yoelii]
MHAQRPNKHFLLYPNPQLIFSTFVHFLIVCYCLNGILYVILFFIYNCLNIELFFEI